MVSRNLPLFITFCFFFFCSIQPLAAADFMRSIGKIYVVTGVMLVLLLGIAVFLLVLDRRLTQLENQIKSDE